MGSILRVRTLFDYDDVDRSTKKYLFDLLNKYTVSNYQYGDMIIQPLASDVLISDRSNLVCLAADHELQILVYIGNVLRLSGNSDLFQLKLDTTFTVRVTNNSANAVRLMFVTAEVV